MADGDVTADPAHIFVGCTAAGLNTAPVIPLFENGKTNLHFMTLGVAPRSATVVARIESLDLPRERRTVWAQPSPAPLMSLDA